MLNKMRPRRVAKTPKNFVMVSEEPNTTTETIVKSTKLAEYIATL